MSSRPIRPDLPPLPYNCGPDRSLEACTLAEMVECIRPCDTDVWRSRFLTRTFWLRWSGQEPDVRAAMIAEEPLPLEDVRWDAFIAGFAHELSRRYRLDPPGWALKPTRYLDHVWPIFDQGGIGAYLTAMSPAPWLLEHGLLVEDYNLMSAQQLIEGEGSVITWKSPAWREERIRPGEPSPQAALDAFEQIARLFENIGVYAGIHLTGNAAFELAQSARLDHSDVGGAAVDASSDAGHAAVRAAAADAAADRSWPDDWLSRLPAPGLDQDNPAASSSLFYHPHLIVRASSPAHLAGLLMMSGRRRDARTLARLLPRMPGVRTAEDLVAAARRFAPDSKVPEAALTATAEASLERAVGSSAV